MATGRQAALDSGTPVFLFFKLKSGCDECKNFIPVWERIREDRLLSRYLCFVEYNIGPDGAKYYKPAPEYEAIVQEYGRVPLFLIHLPGGGSDIIDLGHGPKPRTFDNMKATIIDALTRAGYTVK